VEVTEEIGVEEDKGLEGIGEGEGEGEGEGVGGVTDCDGVVRGLALVLKEDEGVELDDEGLDEAFFIVCTKLVL
jgi:hypothetical protein